jgi:predicted secreted hydrolase
MSVLAAAPDEGFERPSPSWELDLPDDHAAHGASRTETWQISAYLRTEGGDDLGAQVSFFRLGVTPPGSPPGETWEVRELYRGHVAWLDAASSGSSGEERFARGIPGLAGYDPEAGELRLDNWALAIDGNGFRVQATVLDDARMTLVMVPGKPAVAPGGNGAGAPFVGYALTRLAVTGTVDRGAGDEPVSGTAWLDHSWGELPIPGAGPVAWDRLQGQLDDGSDVSVVRSRRTDGRGSPTLSGAIVAPGGAVSAFDEAALRMTPVRTWRDPATGIAYPVAWRLEGAGMELEVEPVIEAQSQSFSAPVWNGMVRLNGTRSGVPVTGSGTLQLTGYSAG